MGVGGGDALNGQLDAARHLPAGSRPPRGADATAALRASGVPQTRPDQPGRATTSRGARDLCRKESRVEWHRVVLQAILALVSQNGELRDEVGAQAQRLVLRAGGGEAQRRGSGGRQSAAGVQTASERVGEPAGGRAPLAALASRPPPPQRVPVAATSLRRVPKGAAAQDPGRGRRGEGQATLGLATAHRHVALAGIVPALRRSHSRGALDRRMSRHAVPASAP